MANQLPEVLRFDCMAWESPIATPSCSGCLQILWLDYVLDHVVGFVAKRSSRRGMIAFSDVLRMCFADFLQA